MVTDETEMHHLVAVILDRSKTNISGSISVDSHEVLNNRMIQ